MTQKRLGSHDDEWLAERQSNLAPQDVEIVRRSGAVGDNPVDVVQLTDGELLALGREVVGIIRGHLQEAFQASAGVLRSL